MTLNSSSVAIHCKGILFDMDGILISSIGSVERCWTRWAKAHGISPEYACKMAHGRRSIETVAELCPDLDAEAENRIIEEMEMQDTEGVTALPGVAQFLASLPTHRWTVVTSATGPLAKVRLEAGGIPTPKDFVTAESVIEGKPHPEPYLAGAALLGLKPEECVVFEDAASGVKAGKAAGCTVIATTFSHSKEALQEADYLIQDMVAVKATALPNEEGLLLTLDLFE